MSYRVIYCHDTNDRYDGLDALDPVGSKRLENGSSCQLESLRVLGTGVAAWDGTARTTPAGPESTSSQFRRDRPQTRGVKADNTMFEIIKVESGDGRDYPAEKGKPNDENRNMTAATVIVRHGSITFSMAVYASFVRGRKEDTLTFRLPPTVPKGIKVADEAISDLQDQSRTAFVAWLRENGGKLADRRSGGSSLTELLKAE